MNNNLILNLICTNCNLESKNGQIFFCKQSKSGERFTYVKSINMRRNMRTFGRILQHSSNRLTNAFKSFSRTNLWPCVFSWFVRIFFRLFSLTDPDPIKAECFLQEINDFRMNLRKTNKQIDLYSYQLPKYSTSDLNSSLLGAISIQTSIEHLRTSIDDDNNEENTNSEEESVEINDNESIKSDETPQQIDERTETPTPTNKTLLGNISNKKLLWSIHFKFVPQYIVLYRQSILFASDRWGFVRWMFSFELFINLSTLLAHGHTRMHVLNQHQKNPLFFFHSFELEHGLVFTSNHSAFVSHIR